MTGLPDELSKTVYELQELMLTCDFLSFFTLFTFDLGILWFMQAFLHPVHNALLSEQ
jgi:hypothetical protein